MCYHIILSLLAVCGSLNHADAEENRNVSHTRVAFVFAGGVRTFLLPSVHQSMKYNLIHAFCAPSLCNADVFARLSIADNNLNGLDAKGKLVKGDAARKNEAIAALKSLKHKSFEGRLIYELVDIGSMDESKQMDVWTSKSRKQNIYRKLDSRRYSMHFNRWTAYNMMLYMEKELGVRYDWVVHARLDMGWGAPIKPYHSWSTKKIHVPDSWYMNVPDTFALLPRNFSDTYFSIDGIYETPGVMCLGGPNLDVRTLSESALRRRGFNEEDIKVVQEEDCFKKIDQSVHATVFEKSTNTNWTTSGVSELILKRKLAHFGVSLNRKTLGFSTFFTFIIRTPHSALCFYLEPDKFIPWVKQVQHLSVPTGTGCNVMKHELIERGKDFSDNCNIETFQSKHVAIGHPKRTCLLDKAMTDWNFLPFRLQKPPGGSKEDQKVDRKEMTERRQQQCLTIASYGSPGGDTSYGSPGSSKSPPHKLLRDADCIDSAPRSSRPDFTGDYDESQLFHLHPLSPLPQRISTFDFSLSSGMHCLTVSSTYALETFVVAGGGGGGGEAGGDISAGAFDTVHRPIVELAPCKTDPEDVSQLFRIKLPLKQFSQQSKAGLAALSGLAGLQELGTSVDRVRNPLLANRSFTIRGNSSSSSISNSSSNNNNNNNNNNKLNYTSESVYDSLDDSMLFSQLLPNKVVAYIQWYGSSSDLPLCLSQSVPDIDPETRDRHATGSDLNQSGPAGSGGIGGHGTGLTAVSNRPRAHILRYDAATPLKNNRQPVSDAQNEQKMKSFTRERTTVHRRPGEDAAAAAAASAAASVGRDHRGAMSTVRSTVSGTGPESEGLSVKSLSIAVLEPCLPTSVDIDGKTKDAAKVEGRKPKDRPKDSVDTRALLRSSDQHHGTTRKHSKNVVFILERTEIKSPTT